MPDSAKVSDTASGLSSVASGLSSINESATKFGTILGASSYVPYSGYTSILTDNNYSSAVGDYDFAKNLSGFTGTLGAGLSVGRAFETGKTSDYASAAGGIGGLFIPGSSGLGSLASSALSIGEDGFTWSNTPKFFAQGAAAYAGAATGMAFGPTAAAKSADYAVGLVDMGIGGGNLAASAVTDFAAPVVGDYLYGNTARLTPVARNPERHSFEDSFSEFDLSPEPSHFSSPSDSYRSSYNESRGGHSDDDVGSDYGNGSSAFSEEYHSYSGNTPWSSPLGYSGYASSSGAVDGGYVSSSLSPWSSTLGEPEGFTGFLGGSYGSGSLFGPYESVSALHYTPIMGGGMTFGSYNPLDPNL